MAEEHRTIDEPDGRSAAERQRIQLNRTKRVIWFLVNTVSILILLRFVLKALGANEANVFAQIFYAITDPLVWPFLDLFGTPPRFGTPPNENVFEFSVFVAIAVYYFLAWVIVKIINFAVTRPGSDDM